MRVKGEEGVNSTAVHPSGVLYHMNNSCLWVTGLRVIFSLLLFHNFLSCPKCLLQSEIKQDQVIEEGQSQRANSWKRTYASGLSSSTRATGQAVHSPLPGPASALPRTELTFVPPVSVPATIGTEMILQKLPELTH